MARPGVVQVRLIGPPAVLDTAAEYLAEELGESWQPSTRKPGRRAGGDHLLYGTLVVALPGEGGPRG